MMEFVYEKLQLEDHQKTRTLWEEVFHEDTKEFIDYYYTHMVDHNQIYVATSSEGVIGMLHLNPYVIDVKGRDFSANYIVGVATKESYRGQGIMRKLLTRAMKDMYDRGEAFTYLMPAAEAIYSPYGFLTVGGQTHYEYMGERKDGLFAHEDPAIGFEWAKETDCRMLGEFANRQIGKIADIHTKRNEDYYKRLLKEQECQHGGIVLIKREGRFIGYCLVANEGYCQVRELITSDERFELELKVKEEPKIMVRILDVMKILPLMPRENGTFPTIHVVDPIIEDNTGVYQITPAYACPRCKKLSDEVDLEQAITIEALAEKIFGKKNIMINEIV